MMKPKYLHLGTNYSHNWKKAESAHYVTIKTASSQKKPALSSKQALTKMRTTY